MFHSTKVHPTELLAIFIAKSQHSISKNVRSLHSSFLKTVHTKTSVLFHTCLLDHYCISFLTVVIDALVQPSRWMDYIKKKILIWKVEIPKVISRLHLIENSIELTIQYTGNSVDGTCKRYVLVTHGIMWVYANYFQLAQ